MSLLLSSPYTIVGDVFAQTNSSNSTNTDTTTDTTNSGDLQQFTTYNFNEVTFQGSHVWATTTGHSPTFKAETSGSVYPISSLVGGPEDFTAQVEGTGKVKMTATRETPEGEICTYEYEANYKIEGKATYSSFTNRYSPNGTLSVRIEEVPSAAVYAPLKDGSEDCYDRFPFGYYPMLLCHGEDDINIAEGQKKDEFRRSAGNEHELCILKLSDTNSPPDECPAEPTGEPAPTLTTANQPAIVPVTTATAGDCPSPNSPPIAVAKLLVPGNIPYVNNLVRLDGRESYDPDPKDPVVAWKWTKTSPSDGIVPNTLTNPTSSVAEFKIPNYIPAQFTSRTSPPNLLPIEFSLEVVDNHGTKSTNTDTSKVSLDVKCFDDDLRSANHARDYLLTAVNIPAAKSLYPQTADNFLYFLAGGGDTEGRPKGVSGKGAPDSLPIEWLENTVQFGNAQTELVSQIQKDIEKMLKEMKMGETRALPFDGSDGRYRYFIKGDKSVLTDFEGAVGDVTAYAYPHLEVTKKGRFDLDTVSGYIRFKLPDIYDFNKGMEFEIPGIGLFKGKVKADDLHNAIKCLGARNFDQTTAYNKIITDMPFNYLPQRTSHCYNYPSTCQIQP